MGSIMYLCFDIGGTHIKGGVLDEQGKIQAKREVDTNLHGGPQGIARQLKEMEGEFMRENPAWGQEVKGVGIGVPGFTEKGWVWEAVNLGWKNEDFLEIMKSVFPFPIFILNDANAAALGELWLGSGQGIKDFICVTLGTGIGAGVVINSAIHIGKYGMAGEIGHFQCGTEKGYLCHCGNRGCLETLSSATAIASRAKEEEKKGMSPELSRILREKGNLKSRDVINVARKGDPVAIRVLEEAGAILGRALGNIFLVFAPDKILLGGGVSKAGPLLLHSVREGFKEIVPRQMKKEQVIFLAKLGNDAGMIGLAKYVKMNLGNEGEKNA